MLTLFPWARFRRAKAAVKMHTLLDLRGNIPTFITSPTESSGRERARRVPARGGAFYVMDRGYIDFERLYRFTLESAFFVVRTKSNYCCSGATSHPVDPSAGVRSDQTVILASLASASAYPDALRKVSYVDAETGKRLVFLTNNSLCPPRPLPHSTSSAGRWSCSSNGSSNTCASRPSMALV